jgi:hypothetical protein
MSDVVRDASLVTSIPSRAAVVADAFALVAFVLIGSASHDRGSAIEPLVRTGVPLLASWYVVAWLARTYRRADVRTLLVTWIVSVPVAAVIRSAFADGPWDASLVVFVGVALAFTLLLVVAVRALFGLATPRWRRRSVEARG